MLFGMLLVKTGKFEKKWGKFLANLKDDREAGDYDALSYSGCGHGKAKCGKSGRVRSRC